ncbi:MAG: triphosphoribosyl-dephospho-CoA synthase [Candidatus Velthaea sp.]
MTHELARAATGALLQELAVTPKPGLVDLEHRGAHRDLSCARLAASGAALESYFAEIARAARDAAPSRALREEIGDIGRRGERAMLRASGGSNTHRGALWALGLLVAGAAGSGGADARAIARRAGALARLPDRFSPPAPSHGRIAARRYGAGGARGEAAASFPHVTKCALPLLCGGAARTDVLLALMARVDDTCLLHRGGTAALYAAKTGARAALAAGGMATAQGRRTVRALDGALLARNASPGGCADLLAAGLFLHAIAR